MPTATAALDFQKASGIIRKMQDCINNIHKYSGSYVGASETALEKSTEQKWMRDIVNTGNETQKQCVEVSEACDTIVDGLRKYDEDLRDFVESGLGGDI